jgi:hypothetical protein
MQYIPCSSAQSRDVVLRGNELSVPICSLRDAKHENAGLAELGQGVVSSRRLRAVWRTLASRVIGNTVRPFNTITLSVLSVTTEAACTAVAHPNTEASTSKALRAAVAQMFVIGN